MKKKLGFGVPIVVLAAALLMLAVSTDAVEAARGGGKGGGKPGGGSTPTATLTVSPNPVPVGTYATVTGTGFKPGATINWIIGSSAIGGMANDYGVASISLMTYSPGTITVTANQFVGGSWVFAGSVTFTVVSA